MEAYKGSMQESEKLKKELIRYEQKYKELQTKVEELKKLEHSEARLRMAITSTKLGTWEWDLNTGALYWSAECKNIFGLSEDTPVTTSFFMSRIHQDDRGLVENEIRTIARNGYGECDFTFRILHYTNNDIRSIRLQGSIFLNKANLPGRFIGTALDITSDRQNEEKIAKLAAIIESSDDAIVSKTLEGIVTSWNYSAERTFGYTEEEMIGHPILKIIPLDRHDEEVHILSKLRKGERVEHFETKRLTKWGNLVDVSLTISPIKDNRGNIIGLSKIARDITEKKQEEQRKNAFVAIVSHELKTPLTSITGYLQMLLMRADKIGDNYMTNILIRAQHQSKKMISMIRDFLSLARLEEGKIEINKETFELYPLIKEITSDAQLLTSRHVIEILNCNDITVFADQDKIGQVLMNLLSNAIKYSPSGGTIIVGCEASSKDVKVYVKDEGVGISPIDQHRLFERFFRSKNEQLKSISGFGIGLYLVSEILRYHDSQIKVESTEGKGSTFHFILSKT